MKIYPKYGTFFILLLLPFVTHALGFEIVHDPWNEIQNATTATNSVTTAVNSGKMLANQLTELANQARLLQIELANIKSYQGQKSWSNAEPLLQQLAKQIAETQTLAYSMQNVDSAFQTLYPGFQAPTDYPTSYQRWSTTTLNTLRTTLDAAGIQAQHFDAEQEALQSTGDTERQRRRTLASPTGRQSHCGCSSHPIASLAAIGDSANQCAKCLYGLSSAKRPGFRSGADEMAG